MNRTAVGLSRPSTSGRARGPKTWMAGTGPGMTTSDTIAAIFLPFDRQEFFSPLMTGPNSSQLSPLKRIICSCSSGAKSVGPVLIFVPGR